MDKKILAYYKKYDSLAYHQLMIQTIRERTRNIMLPIISTARMEEYKTKYLSNYTIQGEIKELKYKFKNIRDAFLVINKKQPEDKEINTIITWLKEYEYIIDLIDQDPEDHKLKRILQTYNTEITIFNNLYEELIKDQMIGNYQDIDEIN